MRYAPELLTALAALLGWFLLTWVAASLISPWAWPASGGLLLLSICGWRFLAVIAWRGLYDLSRDPGGDDDA